MLNKDSKTRKVHNTFSIWTFSLDCTGEQKII